MQGSLQWMHQMKPTQRQICWGRMERIQTLPLVSDFCSSALGLGAHKLPLPTLNFLWAPHIWCTAWGRFREPVARCRILNFSHISAPQCCPGPAGNDPVTWPCFIRKLYLSEVHSLPPIVQTQFQAINALFEVLLLIIAKDHMFLFPLWLGV